MAEKRVAIITGATRGIGRGLYERLLARNVSVAAVYSRDDEAAAAFLKTAEEAGVACLIRRINVADYEGMRGFVRTVIEEFGQIDYLVNNVGGDIFKTVYDMTFDEWLTSQNLILNRSFFVRRCFLICAAVVLAGLSILALPPKTISRVHPD